MTEILVPADLVKKCEAKARAAVKNNAAKRYRDKYSKGAQTKAKNIDTMKAGFLAEVAMCIYLGLDPDDELTWRADRPDGGYDIKFPYSGHTIDVKASTNVLASRLLWPVTKLDKLATAAEIFVFTRVPESKATPAGQVVELCGWVTKKEFISQHWKAKGINGIVDGTPYMNEKSLYSMEQIVQHLGDVKATGSI